MIKPSEPLAVVNAGMGPFDRTTKIAQAVEVSVDTEMECIATRNPAAPAVWVGWPPGRRTNHITKRINIKGFECRRTIGLTPGAHRLSSSPLSVDTDKPSNVGSRRASARIYEVESSAQSVRSLPSVVS